MPVLLRFRAIRPDCLFLRPCSCFPSPYEAGRNHMTCCTRNTDKFDESFTKTISQHSMASLDVLFFPHYSKRVGILSVVSYLLFRYNLK
jgi:hypothetical protein